MLNTCRDAARDKLALVRMDRSAPAADALSRLELQVISRGPCPARPSWEKFRKMIVAKRGEMTMGPMRGGERLGLL